MEPVVIERAAEALRARRRDLVAAYGLAGLQGRVVSAIGDAADLWADPAYAGRTKARAASASFPYEMVDVSLRGLLPSLASSRLLALIAAEDPDLSRSPELIGHVLASNTPLLGWTTVLRALLVGSASLVKLPSSAEAVWLALLVESLSDVAPELAGLVDTLVWRGGDDRFDKVFAESTDRLVVYGSDETLRAYSELCESTKRVGYGHRVSLGIVLRGADYAKAARGFAIDILTYDQGGCLSPHTILVDGDHAAACDFGDALAGALASCDLPALAPRTGPRRSARVREARQLARFEANARVWEADDLRWTVIGVSERKFRFSPTHGVVYLVPFAFRELPRILEPVSSLLQGAGIAACRKTDEREISVVLSRYGVSYTCCPGALQAPPFEWREDGRDLLNTLLKM